MSAVPHARPATRWVVRPNLEVTASLQSTRAQHDAVPCVSGPVQALLVADLSRGHVYIAIRHYLMLRASGAPVPAPVAEECTALLKACPARRLQRIAVDVERWFQTVSRRPDAGSLGTRPHPANQGVEGS